MKQDIREGARRGALMDRYLSQVDVWAIAFGCIIGWGAFVMPGTTFLPIAGPGGTVLAMAVSAVIMVIIGMNYAYLMVRRPGTGGVYSYTREAFGQDHAFLSAWFLSLSYVSIVFLNATALLVVSRTLFGGSLQVGFHYVVAGFDVYLGEVALSVICLVSIGILFIRCKPFLQHFQTALAILLLLGTLVIAICCLPSLRLDLQGDFFGNGNNNPAAVIITIVLLSPWAFVGFDVISLETAHFSFPVRRSRWIMLLSIILGSFVYIALSLLSVTAVPEGYASWREYMAGLDALSGLATVPSFYAASACLGTPGMVIMGLTALAAILTGVIGAYRATIRVLSALGEDGILSERFTGTTFCVLFVMVISVLVSFLGRNALEWFVELTTFGAIVGFGYTSASALRLAREEKNKRIVFTGILGTIITIAFAVAQLVPKVTVLETMGAESFLMLAFWCLLGYVFYWKTMKKGIAEAYNGGATSSTVLFSLLLYSIFMWFALKLMEVAPSQDIFKEMLRDGLVAASLMALGLLVMVYIQNHLRLKQKSMERAKIMAEERSRAKTRFLFNMSHDIRTPMNAILGYISLAKKEEASPLLEDYLGKIETSSKSLLDLINDILEMSRIESGTVELEQNPTDLFDLLDDLGESFEPQMREKGLSFSVDDSHIRHPYVLCDKKSLTRILSNLVSNAFKFTPQGGAITLTIWEVGEGEHGTGSYEIRIRDTGIGMSEEFASKMFTAFERERTSTISGVQGTGLGLAITKGILDLMGGTIEVDTALGEGTEFRVYVRFPLCAPEEIQEAAPKEEAGETMDFTGMRLLLVEDNYINREIASVVLKKMGFVVEMAENGQVAVDKVLSLPEGYYNVILMDIQMPVMDGYEATRIIRGVRSRHRTGVPILAMTANAFEEDKRRAKEAGMDGHVAKPIDLEELSKALSGVLGVAKSHKGRGKP